MSLPHGSLCSQPLVHLVTVAMLSTTMCVRIVADTNRLTHSPISGELKDAELLPHLSRPNPHKSHWHDMMLFLRFQVEEYAFTKKWGSAEALDAEFERREAAKKKSKEKKFKERLFELKRKTRTEAMRRERAEAGQGGGGGATKFGDSVGRSERHVHEWGRVLENEEGATVKTCVECGMEVEELEF